LAKPGANNVTLLAENPAQGPSWPEKFAEERTCLLAALGDLLDGGIVKQIQHVGATSVAQLIGQPCLDIALQVWPFPLSPAHQSALAALGYAPVTDFTTATELRFRHTNGTIQLFIVEWGSERWPPYQVLGDYFQQNALVRTHYASAKLQWGAPTATADSPYTQAKIEYFRQLLPTARQWWAEQRGFAPIESLTQELAGFAPPWYVAGGWALDLFLGRVTRIHEDIDVEIARPDSLILQHHMNERGWRFLTPLHGQLEPWPPHMRLELPRHQAHAHRGEEFIDFMLTDTADGIWRYRRQPTIVQSLALATLKSESGVPFLAPELVLLFKSKNTGKHERGKDQLDFERVSPLLSAERRAWLRWALLNTNPAHPWLASLE